MLLIEPTNETQNYCDSPKIAILQLIYLHHADLFISNIPQIMHSNRCDSRVPLVTTQTSILNESVRKYFWIFIFFYLLTFSNSLVSFLLLLPCLSSSVMRAEFLLSHLLFFGVVKEGTHEIFFLSVSLSLHGLRRAGRREKWKINILGRFFAFFVEFCFNFGWEELMDG